MSATTSSQAFQRRANGLGSAKALSKMMVPWFNLASLTGPTKGLAGFE